MTRQFKMILSLGLCLSYAQFAAADESVAASTPDPVPVTRDDVKRALDASKQSTPRLPLPPVTPEEKALIEEQQAQAAKGGEKPRRYGLANNGRMRAYYLADYGFERSKDLDRARAGTNNQNTDSVFEPSFRTMLFWIVSRGNNCTYCLGHQESGLASRGMSDDELAALDTDWSVFDAAKQAAFAFTTKLSFEPYAINDGDIVALRKHFNDAQIAEIVQTVAGFNSTNRWTGTLRIKQDVLFPFVRPTSEKYVAAVSLVAPASAATGAGFVPPKSRARPALESRDQVAAALEAARKRTPRLPLADESATKAQLTGGSSDAAPPQWMRLLAVQPKTGAERMTSYKAVFEKGTLDPRSKAIIAYVGARNDRAWYALGHAIARLKGLGFTDDQVFALDEPKSLSAPLDREVVQFARTITVDPALITDADFARMSKLLDDQKVAEVVYQITQAAFFDRLTEAAGLQLEN